MTTFIGITGSVREKEMRHHLPLSYVTAVQKAGGVPWVIPAFPSEGEFYPEYYLGKLDGLLLTGGVDVDPCHFGEEPKPDLGSVSPWRDQLEIPLTRAALQKDIPILAICRGIQVLNVAAGGTLLQDLGEHDEDLLKHRQKSPGWHGSHSVTVESDAKLADILDLDEQESCLVNSFHHQAIEKAGENLIVSARAPDGIIEAVESLEHLFILGVQWHPERMVNHRDDMLRLFSCLVDKANEFSDGRDEF